MSRVAARFGALREQGRKALIPYITAGDPQPDVTVPLMHALVEAGADGVFSNRAEELRKAWRERFPGQG